MTKKTFYERHHDSLTYNDMLSFCKINDLDINDIKVTFDYDEGGLELVGTRDKTDKELAEEKARREESIQRNKEFKENQKKSAEQAELKEYIRLRKKFGPKLKELNQK